MNIVQEKHLHVPKGQGQKWRVMDSLVEVKLSPQQTGGKYSIIEVTTPPGGGASFLHTHEPAETFYVLEGNFEFPGMGEEGAYAIQASPGTSVHIPAGVPHGFQNVGSSTGRLLAVFHPAGRMTDFFKAMHEAVHHLEPLDASPEFWPEPEEALAVHEQYGLYLLPSEEQPVTQ